MKILNETHLQYEQLENILIEHHRGGVSPVYRLVREKGRKRRYITETFCSYHSEFKIKIKATRYAIVYYYAYITHQWLDAHVMLRILFYESS